MRWLLAIDQFAPSRAATDFAAGLAVESGAAVWVFHVREVPNAMQVSPLETAVESDDLVHAAVMLLRQAGVSAGGRSVSAPQKLVANRIAGEGLLLGSDAIVLGSRRLAGIRRLSGRGLRDRLLRLSPLPVLVAPTPLRMSARGLPSFPDAGEGERHHEPSSLWPLHDGGRG
jgi:nucleotide-binding universal stress UspA family protein